MAETSQILGTFSFEDFDDKGPQSGVITNFLGPDGREVGHPGEAECWVGQVLEGSLAGQWLSMPIDDDEEDKWSRHSMH